MRTDFPSRYPIVVFKSGIRKSKILFSFFIILFIICLFLSAVVWPYLPIIILLFYVYFFAKPLYLLIHKHKHIGDLTITSNTLTIDLKSDYRIYKLSEIKGINIRPLAPHWESELNGRTTEKPFLAYEITIKVNLKDHYKCQVLNDGECEKGNLNYLHGLFNDFKYLTESGIKLWDENGGQSMFG